MKNIKFSVYGVQENGNYLFSSHEVILEIEELQAKITKQNTKIKALKNKLKSERKCSNRNDRDNFDLLSKIGSEELFNKYAEYVHMCKVMRTEPKFNEWISEQSTKLLESEK